MIERVTKRVVGADADWSRDIMTLEFADATAVYVPGQHIRRCVSDQAVLLTAYNATLELVDGRWLLARLDLAERVTR